MSMPDTSKLEDAQKKQMQEQEDERKSQEQQAFDKFQASKRMGAGGSPLGTQLGKGTSSTLGK